MAYLFSDFVRQLRSREQHAMATTGIRRPSIAGIEEHVSSRALPQVRGAISAKKQELALKDISTSREQFGQRMGLARERLSLGRRSFDVGKKMFPWSVGLRAADIGLAGLSGFQQLKQQDIEVAGLRKYRADILRAVR